MCMTFLNRYKRGKFYSENYYRIYQTKFCAGFTHAIIANEMTKDFLYIYYRIIKFHPHFFNVYHLFLLLFPK